MAEYSGRKTKTAKAHTAMGMGNVGKMEEVTQKKKR